MQLAHWLAHRALLFYEYSPPSQLPHLPRIRLIGGLEMAPLGRSRGAMAFLSMGFPSTWGFITRPDKNIMRGQDPRVWRRSLPSRWARPPLHTHLRAPLAAWADRWFPPHTPVETKGNKPKRTPAPSRSPHKGKPISTSWYAINKNGVDSNRSHIMDNAKFG